MYRAPCTHIFVAITFLLNSFGAMPAVQAQGLSLPVPGVMVRLSPPLDPPILKGIKVNPDDPFRFDFILDRGDAYDRPLKQETTRLIKYFLASLTIPENDLWVNLSPYEKNRVIPHSFGLTEMGRDLLAEDYMLKQITASLIYPEDALGRAFWKRVYEEATKKFGTTNIPVSTFNKVWIVPEKAVVYENAQAGTAYVVESKLKVMLEQDYLSMSKHQMSTQMPAPQGNAGTPNDNVGALGSNIIREIVLPELNREVNENKNFAQLRQVYNSLILATWYKKKIKDSILEQVYNDKNKVTGVEYKDAINTGAIYQRYLQAFKKGVYSYIKEDVDPRTQEATPRKYFSGGLNLLLKMNEAMITTDQLPAGRALFDTKRNEIVQVRLARMVRAVDRAMASPEKLSNNDIKFRIEDYPKHISSDARKVIIRSFVPYIRKNAEVMELYKGILFGKYWEKDQDPKVVATIAGERKIEALVPGVARMLTVVTNNSDRLVYVEALLNIGSKKALEALKDSMGFIDSISRFQLFFKSNIDFLDPRIFPLLEILSKDQDRFIRRNVAIVLRQQNNRNAIRLLLDALRDTDGEVVKNALESLSLIGDEDTVAKLRDFARSEPGSVRMSLVDDHGSMVFVKDFVKGSEYNQGSYNELALREVPNPVLDSVLTAISVINNKLIQDRLKVKPVKLEDARDKVVKAFFDFLKEKDGGLENDLVVIGGGVRDLITDSKLNDIDISFKVPLTLKQRTSFAGTDTQINEATYDYMMSKLKLLAKVLKVNVGDFLEFKGKGVTWRGVSVQYAGPIVKVVDKSKNKKVFIKRVLVDSNSRAIYSSSSGVSFLQLAVDHLGNVYGRIQALDDYKRGYVRIVGDPESFSLGDILRAVRICQELELKLYPWDEDLIKKVVKEYSTGRKSSTNEEIRKIEARQYHTIFAKARDPQKALKQVEALGLKDLFNSWGISEKGALELRSDHLKLDFEPAPETQEVITSQQVTGDKAMRVEAGKERFRSLVAPLYIYKTSQDPDTQMQNLAVMLIRNGSQRRALSKDWALSFLDLYYASLSESKLTHDMEYEPLLLKIIDDFGKRLKLPPGLIGKIKQSALVVKSQNYSLKDSDREILSQISAERHLIEAHPDQVNIHELKTFRTESFDPASDKDFYKLAEQIALFHISDLFSSYHGVVNVGHLKEQRLILIVNPLVMLASQIFIETKKVVTAQELLMFLGSDEFKRKKEELGKILSEEDTVNLVYRELASEIGHLFFDYFAPQAPVGPVHEFFDVLSQDSANQMELPLFDANKQELFEVLLDMESKNELSMTVPTLFKEHGWSAEEYWFKMAIDEISSRNSFARKLADNKYAELRSNFDTDPVYYNHFMGRQMKDWLLINRFKGDMNKMLEASGKTLMKLTHFSLSQQEGILGNLNKFIDFMNADFAMASRAGAHEFAFVVVGKYVFEYGGKDALGVTTYKISRQGAPGELGAIELFNASKKDMPRVAIVGFKGADPKDPGHDVTALLNSIVPSGALDGFLNYIRVGFSQGSKMVYQVHEDAAKELEPYSKIIKYGTEYSYRVDSNDHSKGIKKDFAMKSYGEQDRAGQFAPVLVKYIAEMGKKRDARNRLRIVLAGTGLREVEYTLQMIKGIEESSSKNFFADIAGFSKSRDTVDKINQKMAGISRGGWAVDFKAKDLLEDSGILGRNNDVIVSQNSFYLSRGLDPSDAQFALKQKEFVNHVSLSLRSGGIFIIEDSGTENGDLSFIENEGFSVLKLKGLAGQIVFIKKIAKDRASESSTGGIDLTPANMNLLTKNAGQGIRFHMDPAMLEELKNSPGFTPVIINILPLNDLRQFLGITATKSLHV